MFGEIRTETGEEDDGVDELSAVDVLAAQHTVCTVRDGLKESL